MSAPSHARKSFGRKAAVAPAVYLVFAEGIRRLPDPAIRQTVADHFATYFAGRSPSFDPQRWFEATGGKVKPKIEAA